MKFSENIEINFNINYAIYFSIILGLLINSFFYLFLYGSITILILLINEYKLKLHFFLNSKKKILLIFFLILTIITLIIYSRNLIKRSILIIAGACIISCNYLHAAQGVRYRIVYVVLSSSCPRTVRTVRHTQYGIVHLALMRTRGHGACVLPRPCRLICYCFLIVLLIVQLKAVLERGCGAAPGSLQLTPSPAASPQCV